jgi:hypothetical protein
MNRERIRGILGVWMPLVIGLWFIATSILFYVTANLTASGPFGQDLESWRLVCSAGVFFVGGLMLLSTFGRYQKARAVALQAASTPPMDRPSDAPNDDRPRIVK